MIALFRDVARRLRDARAQLVSRVRNRLWTWLSLGQVLEAADVAVLGPDGLTAARLSEHGLTLFDRAGRARTYVGVVDLPDGGNAAVLGLYDTARSAGLTLSMPADGSASIELSDRGKRPRVAVSIPKNLSDPASIEVFDEHGRCVFDSSGLHPDVARGDHTLGEHPPNPN